MKAGHQHGAKARWCSTPKAVVGPFDDERPVVYRMLFRVALAYCKIFQGTLVVPPNGAPAYHAQQQPEEKNASQRWRTPPPPHHVVAAAAQASMDALASVL